VIPPLGRASSVYSARVGHVLFICEGNLCRSPFAERVLAHALEGVPGPRIRIASAGFSPIEGLGIPPETARLIETLGGSAQGHQARRLHTVDVESASLVFTATRGQRSRAVQRYPRAVQYTFTMRQVAAVLGPAFAHGLPPVDTSLPAEERAAAFAELMRTRRGLLGEDPALDDVIDPFGKPLRRHVQAASEMMPALVLLAQGLGGRTLEVPEFLQVASVKAGRSRLGRRSAR